MTSKRTELPSESRRYAVCVANEGCEASLERNKIYTVVADPDAEADGDIRVVDESGEDYLFPGTWFVDIEVPAAVEASLRRVGAAASARRPVKSPEGTSVSRACS